MESNLTEDSGSLTALCGTFIVLTTVATALRFTARYRQKAQYKADDFILIPTWMIFIGTCSVVFKGLHDHLLGVPLPSDSKQELIDATNLEILFFAFNVLSTIAQGFVKISAILFYRRIFCPSGHASKFSIYLTALLALIVTWLLTFLIMPFVQCGTSLPLLWGSNAREKAQQCPIILSWLLSQAVTDFALEVIVLASPMVPIAKLHTSLSRRLGIALIFLVALVSVGACLGRMVLVVQGVRSSRNVTQGKQLDPSFGDNEVIWLGILESGIAIVAVNIPSLYWLFRHSSPETVLRSIRSLVSLQSIRSGGSRGMRPKEARGASKDSTAERDTPERLPTNSRPPKIHSEPIVSDVENSISSSAFAEDTESNQARPSGGIQVVHSFEQLTTSLNDPEMPDKK